MASLATVKFEAWVNGCPFSSKCCCKQAETAGVQSEQHYGGVARELITCAMRFDCL